MKLGFIGTGNMAGAIMGGVIKSNVFKPEEIIGADLFAPGREKVKELYGINVTDSNKEVIEKSEVVIFSVKPQFSQSFLFTRKQALVSFTAKASRMACFSYSFFPFFQMALEYLAFIFYITFLIHHKLIFLSFSIFCSCSSCAIFIISFTRCGSFSLVLKPSFLALPRKSISLYQIISLSITTKCAE